MLLLIVFAPVIVGGAALMALLLGAATTGAWEALEERPHSRPTTTGPVRFPVAPRETAQARAA